MGRGRRGRGTGRERAPAPRLASGSPAGRPLGMLGEQVEEHPDGDWVVRRLTGVNSAKTYRCPGCSQPIPPALAHVVAWPADAPLLGGQAVDARRHWHSVCWDNRLRRR